jgi:uncharacterized protein (DUF362 family)/NAD-dependent dihydropyrimidine dehydrogenase PreA subunit
VVSATELSGDLRDDLERTLDRIGGLGSIVSGGDRVVLKPNWVGPRRSSAGATTDLDLVRTVGEMVLDLGGVPIIFETPGLEYDQSSVLKAIGAFHYFDESGIELIGNEFSSSAREVPNPLASRRLRLPDVLEGSVIINLPKLKTHTVTTVTLGIKNLMGLLGDSDKRRFHIVGVDRALVDLAAVAAPDLTILDAGLSMEGDGAVYGDIVPTNFILASRNVVSLDQAATMLIGIDWRTIKHISLCAEYLGSTDYEMTGDEIEPFDFDLPRQGGFYRWLYRMLYFVDVIYAPLFKKHFNTFLYSTGRFGTRPVLDPDKCKECGACIEVCSTSSIDLESKCINRKSCIRCLSCYDVCLPKAIEVKGMSRPKERR